MYYRQIIYPPAVARLNFPAPSSSYFLLSVMQQQQYSLNFPATSATLLYSSSSSGAPASSGPSKGQKRGEQRTRSGNLIIHSRARGFVRLPLSLSFSGFSCSVSDECRKEGRDKKSARHCCCCSQATFCRRSLARSLAPLSLSHEHKRTIVTMPTTINLRALSLAPPVRSAPIRAIEIEKLPLQTFLKIRLRIATSRH